MIRRNEIREWIFLILCLIVSLMSCSHQSGSGFLRKEFLEYENVAILPFEGDDTGELSKAFARNFQKRFPEILIRSTAPNPDFQIGVKSAAQYQP